VYRNHDVRSVGSPRMLVSVSIIANPYRAWYCSITAASPTGCGDGECDPASS
jgi:hypothetical protein